MIIKKIHIQVFLLFCFLIVKIFGQDLPPVTNFSPKQYQAQNQNWAISQAEDKTIYIANNSGLLSFNGAVWQLYKSPNETILRSVKVVKDKIYTGCYMEFGYWKENENHQLVYHSLSDKIKDKLIEDEQFWNIIQLENEIIFQSLQSVYAYNVNDETFDIVHFEGEITKLFKTPKGIFFQEKDKGFFQLDKGEEKLISNATVFKNDKVIAMFENGETDLILTQGNGFFKLSGRQILPFTTDLTSDFSNLALYNAIRLKDGSFALGSISNGLLMLDKNGKFQYQINQKKGLHNNTVLSLFEDIDSNIWLGLDNGIGLVNQQSPFKTYDDFDGKIGSVYASVLHEGYLYLGTNQGLFYKKFNSHDDFRFISNTKGQVWNLRVVNNTLFCGHDLGTFIVSKNAVTKINNTNGTWDFRKIDDNRILQGSYKGLQVIEQQGSKWNVRNKINGFDISSRFFEILPPTKVIVNHEYKGVVTLTLNDDFTSVEKTVKDSVSKGAHSGLVAYNNDVLYAYKEGVFKYDKEASKFKKDSLLSTVFNDGYVTGKMVADNNDGDLWAFSKSNIVRVTKGGLSNKPKIEKIPLQNSLRKSVVGYENILKVNESHYLLCTASGLITIDVSKFNDKDFSVVINSIESLQQPYINKQKKGTFENTNNNLTFTYSVAEFDKYFKPSYQYKLKGNKNGNWSSWSSNSSKTFENLPAGSYNFMLRAKIGNQISSNTSSYSFAIKKPWYLSNLMLVMYFVGFLLFSAFMHTMYRRYYKKQQARIIEENQKELKLTQIENEKEIIKIRNEKLREDFKSKSKELASSIMNVVKKNELLTDIRNQLIDFKSEKLNPVIFLIDKSLKQNDDWEYFQEAFNNADSEFLRRLKEVHPKLSPNDLKLCAYLRLNLSSKEIAPLFNISPRSVEIKRYRLRKKMNLQHEQNLVDYILKF